MANDFKVKSPNFSKPNTYEALDFQNNKIVNIPEENLQEALKSGKYGLRKGTKIPVINPAGESGTIDAEEALQAFDSGFKLEAASDQQKREEKKFFEEKSGEAVASTLASTLTFGLSDQTLTKTGLVDPDYLKKLEKYNPVASGIGTVAGIAGPLVASGGASVLAKSAAGAGSAVVGAAEASTAVERAAAKIFEKSLQESGKKSIVKKIIEKSVPKALGSAVEGSAYGTGQLLREDALGDADLNSENLLAYAGTGALVGGSIGGLLGAGEALIPAAKSALPKYKSAIKEYSDPERAAMEVIGISPAKRQKLEKIRPGFSKDVVDVLREPEVLKIAQNIDDLSSTLSSYRDRVGKEISDTMFKMDDIVKSNPQIGKTKKEYLYNQARKLQDIVNDLQKSPEIFKNEINQIQSLTKQYYKESLKSAADELILPSEIWEKRKALDSKINWGKRIQDSPEITKSLYALRNQANDNIYQIANTAESSLDKSIVGDLPSKLRENNKKFSVLKEIADHAEKKASKEKLVSDMDILLGLGGYGVGSQYDVGELGLGVIAAKKFLGSDLRRRMVILSNMERANQKLNTKISSSISNFFKKTKEIAQPVSIGSIMKTDLSKDLDKNKKPKNKLEAYNNISKNISYYSNNPDKLVEKVSRNIIPIQGIAPQITEKTIQNVLNNIKFLNDKLPKKTSKTGLSNVFKKDYMPSDSDFSKFERYLNAVENPVSIVEDIKNRSLTRESVEAVQTLYPNLYENIRDEAMKYVENEGQKVSYQDKVQLSILLDIPADESLDPENIAKLQKLFINEDNEAGNVPVTVGGVSKLKLNETEQTDTEAFLERRQS